MSNEQKPFPVIPGDPHSEVLLNSVHLLGATLIQTGQTARSEKLGKILMVLGTCPRRLDFLYFLIYSKTVEERTSISSWYNNKVYPKSMEYRLDLVNREIGDDLNPFFNQFQLTLHPINERAKEDSDWAPLNELMWAIFCTFFDRKRYDRLIDRIEYIIQNSKEDFDALQRPTLN